ncbi:LuxR C-terminal-related transcriptional regulator [Actinoplanes sp. NPDC024001]|uniref:ATP-binding protein n=1 Tax=Actinoplanes sp. NPDC024001 TaxID=3154598 RepID=UPI0033F08CFC
MAETMREQRRQGNLPAELSSFVDRVAERADLKRLLAVSRVVTVTGPAGVGKTRTVLRVAAEVQRAFPDGAWLADLSPLAQPDLVAETVAQTLGLRDQSARPRAESLVEYLESRRLLLVLDNCEHLADSCTQLVAELLRGAPALRVLVTSRQSLAVQGEQVFPLLPLAVPDPERVAAGDGVDREPSPAMVLFAERSRAASSSFALTETNQAAVARLCRGLDGIPLAIELAAVRARALPVQQIADLLEGRFADRFALLTGGMTGGRHESLRTAVDWSHDLCTRTESLLWARASVFAGDFDLSAAQDVCADDALPASEMLRSVAGLVDKSILLCVEHPTGARYRLLDTLREYGLDMLRNTGDERRLRRRHRDFYLRLAQRFDTDWCGPDQVVWKQRLDREHTNLTSALDFCLTDPAEHQAGLELAAALLFFWNTCGHAREGRHYLDRLLAVEYPPSEALTKALWSAGLLTAMQGDVEAAEMRLGQLRSHAEAHDDTEAAFWITYVTAVCTLFRGDPVRALALAEKAAALHRDRGDPAPGPLMALGTQCIALAVTGQFDRQIAVTERLTALCRRHGELWMGSYASYMRALAEIDRGDLAAAVRCCRDALRSKRQLEDSVGCAMAVDVLARAAAMLGEAERAARLLGVAHRLWQSVGRPQFGWIDLIVARGQVEKLARQTAGDTNFDEAYLDGLNLDPAAGIGYALDEPSLHPAELPPQRAGWAPLTQREREVALLVADGLTNQQIADRLMIGRRTANTHVEHILTKLDFASRAQIAAWAAARQRDDA